MSKRKILKRVLITILIIIAVLAVGVYCVFNFYIKPKYSAQIMDAVNEIMQDEELLAEINSALADEQVQNDINSALSDEKTQSEIATAAAEGVKSSGASAETPDTSAGAANAQSSVNTPENQPQTTKKPSTEGKTPMEIAKENVSPKDFATGMKIAGKIDVGYLSGLSKGGFTPEEKQAAKAHLKSRLSGSEISQLSALISKYSYLLK